MSHFTAWNKVHGEHNTQTAVLAGQLALICLKCGVTQTVDEIDAGIEVER